MSRVDALVALGFVLAAVAEAVVRDHGTPGLLAFDATGSLWLGSLAVRRRRPLVPVCVIAGASVLGITLTTVWWPEAQVDAGVWIFAMMLASYSLGAYGAGRVVLLGVLLPLVVVVVGDATSRTGWERVSGMLFVTVFVGALPTAVGRAVRVATNGCAPSATSTSASCGRSTPSRSPRCWRRGCGPRSDCNRPCWRACRRSPRMPSRPATREDRGDGAGPARQHSGGGAGAGRPGRGVRPSPEVPAADHLPAAREAAQPWTVLAAGAVVAGLAVESSQVLEPSASGWLVVPASLVVGAPLALAWWRPVSMVALAWVAVAAYSRLVAPLDGSLSETALALAAGFAVAALARRRTAAVGLVVCWLGQLVGVGTGDPLGEATLLLLGWLGGLAVNEATRLVEQTRANNELLRRQEATSAARAVVEERLRLAREIHDALGHSLTVVALQAGAARRLAGTDPDRARDVMRTVATAARSGVASLALDEGGADLARRSSRSAAPAWWSTRTSRTKPSSTPGSG